MTGFLLTLRHASAPRPVVFDELAVVSLLGVLSGSTFERLEVLPQVKVVT